MDLERLDEALAIREADGHFAPGQEAEEIVLAAARAYRDLLANGDVEIEEDA